jgi:predicted HicB family RNase H-like nuclease
MEETPKRKPQRPVDLKHKGITGQYVYDEDTQTYSGKLDGVAKGTPFEGKTVADVVQAFTIAVRGFLISRRDRHKLG